jgi:sporulation protein YlmC with PRC-barrel domain
MAYISLKDLKSASGKLPSNTIILRIVNYTGMKLPRYFLNIPRQISTKAGIDIGTLVDVQLDPDHSMLRIQLTKELNGFKVHGQKHTGKNAHLPPNRIVIQFPDFKNAKLPKIKHPIAITEYEINQGLTMRIPEDGRSAKS